MLKSQHRRSVKGRHDMSKTNFTAEAQQFKNEMLKLVEQYEDGDEPDERYQQFVKGFAQKIIGETAIHLNEETYKEIIAAIKIVSKIEDYKGNTFEGNVNSYLDSAIFHVARPSLSLQMLMADVEDEKKEIIINGVTLTIWDAIRIFESMDVIMANISHSIFYKGVCETNDVVTETLGYNPIQKPRQY